jgi:hypothetical protein
MVQQILKFLPFSLFALRFFLSPSIFITASLLAQSAAPQSTTVGGSGKPANPSLPAQQAKPQPAIQPNVIDPFSVGRLPRGTHSGPLSVGEKFAYFEKPVFGPRTVVMTAVGTGIFMANPRGSYTKYPREWLDGAGAFGRNYGDKFARNEASAFGRFSVDSLLHIDPRYSRSASESFFGRAAHALEFTFFSRTDSGHQTLALGNLAGAGASGFVDNAFLPNGWNDPTHAGQRALVTFGGYAAQNLAQEFAPEIVRGFRRLHLPRLPLPPAWWTRSRSN